MSDLSGTIQFTAHILWCAVCALLSYVVGRPVCGHRLAIQHFSWARLSASGVKYDAQLYGGTYSLSFTSPSITIHLALPWYGPDPRWLTFTAESILYKSTTADVSTSHLELVLWFFPYFNRQTAGPLSNIVIEDLCIRIFNSTETPYWIQGLRANLVGTLLTGEIIRADAFKTAIRFSGVTEREDAVANESGEGDENGIHDVQSTRPLTKHDPDDVRFSLVARQLHIDNLKQRIYSFGTVDTELRRNWATDKGSFALVAQECRWVRVHRQSERVAPIGWWSLVAAVFQSPLDLAHALRYPISTVNIYLPRLDVTFDTFRIRDAELLKQGIVLVREKSVVKGLDWSDMFFDALVHLFRY